MGFNPNQARVDQGVTDGGKWRIGQQAEPVSKRDLMAAIRLTQQADPAELGAAFQELQREDAGIDDNTAEAAFAHAAEDQAFDEAFGVYGPVQIPQRPPYALQEWTMRQNGWANRLSSADTAAVNDVMSYAKRRFDDDSRLGTPSPKLALPSRYQMNVAERWNTYNLADDAMGKETREAILAVAHYAEERVFLEPFDEDGRKTAQHPEVQSGAVLDEVSSYGTVYTRRRDGVFPDTSGSMRIQTNRPMNRDEMEQFAGLVGYTYKAEVRGEPMSDPQRDSPCSFLIGSDITKSSSDDTGMAIERFEDALKRYVVEGTPAYKTDRVGPKGTRAMQAMPADLTFELYYDGTP
jgi:hypothetical protein